MVMLVLITLMTVVSVLYVWPGWPKRYLPNFIDYPEGPLLDLGRDAMRLGLDLQGGTYVLTQADTSALPPGTDIDEAMNGVKDVIERRVNATGVAETEVTREGKDRLAVQLPGISPDQAAELIGKTALLEFRTPVRDDSGQIVCIAPDGSEFSVPVTSAAQGVNITTGEKEGQCSGADGSLAGLIKWEPATGLDSTGATRVLTGSFVQPGGADVLAGTAECLPACVTLAFSSEGGLIFSQITEATQGFPLAIFLDEELISAPNVQQEITGGNAIISGLEVDEAKTLSIQINAGSLPVPLETIQQKEIEATLGEKTLVKGVQAGLIGVIAVMFFMIAYYRLPGLLATLALTTYISVVMLVFKIDDPIVGSITMTLPGIAGFVLSIGMAVDGNILVFERMKEELRAGRTLGPAIEHGFSRAWSSIRDSNVSTLITCTILWWFGDQFGADPVRSFAITLAIGVVFSMFSAIVVTRTLLRAVVATPLATRLDLFVPRAAREAKLAAGESRKPFVFDFVKRRAVYFAISAVVIVPGVISLIVPPSLQPGIDFTSGATFTVKFEDTTISTDQLHDVFAASGHNEARIQKTSDGEFIVRTSALKGPSGPPVGPAPPSERDDIEAAFADAFGPFVVTNFNQVSEIISREIIGQSAIALAFAGLAILVYLMWSFRNIPKSYRYGIAAVVAASHDALIILGAFSIFGKVFGTEINREFIAALLTVIGFSVHDTIVVFDRLREKIAANPDVPFDELANASLTETIARSINTSTTVLFTVVALLVLGTGSIDVLLLAFLIGVVAGTYSSIFIATQIVVAWEDGDFGRLWHRFVPRREPRVTAAEPS